MTIDPRILCAAPARRAPGTLARLDRLVCLALGLAVLALVMG